MHALLCCAQLAWLAVHWPLAIKRARYTGRCMRRLALCSILTRLLDHVHGMPCVHVRMQVLSESGIASGVRRIEAVAGPAAVEYLAGVDTLVRGLAGSLKVKPDELPSRVAAMQVRRGGEVQVQREGCRCLGPLVLRVWVHGRMSCPPLHACMRKGVLRPDGACL